jgi:hypothetical protein
MTTATTAIRLGAATRDAGLIDFDCPEQFLSLVRGLKRSADSADKEAMSHPFGSTRREYHAGVRDGITLAIMRVSVMAARTLGYDAIDVPAIRNAPIAAVLGCRQP